MLPSRVVCIAVSGVRQRLVSRPKHRESGPGRPEGRRGSGRHFHGSADRPLGHGLSTGSRRGPHPT